MKINRKGQGSIEYLMILAAVLAIAVVVVVLATTFFSRYERPAEIAQDKSVCASSGIELLNYNKRFVCPYVAGAGSDNDPTVWLSDVGSQSCNRNNPNNNYEGDDSVANMTLEVRHSGETISCGNVTKSKKGQASCPLGVEYSDDCFMIFVDNGVCRIYNDTVACG